MQAFIAIAARWPELTGDASPRKNTALPHMNQYDTLLEMKHLQKDSRTRIQTIIVPGCRESVVLLKSEVCPCGSDLIKDIRRASHSVPTLLGVFSRFH